MFRICCLSVICLFQFVYSSDLSRLPLLTQENVELKQKIIYLEKEIVNWERWAIDTCPLIASLAAIEPQALNGPLNTFLDYNIFKVLKEKSHEFKMKIYEMLPNEAKEGVERVPGAFHIPAPNADNGNWDPDQLRAKYQAAIATEKERVMRAERAAGLLQ